MTIENELMFATVGTIFDDIRQAPWHYVIYANNGRPLVNPSSISYNTEQEALDAGHTCLEYMRKSIRGATQ